MTQASLRPLDCQNMPWTFSTAAISSSALAWSMLTLQALQSLAAFQKVSCRSGKVLHLHVRGQSNHRRHAHAASGLGLLHGLAGASHLLAVIPALALPPVAAFSYLVAYLCGSIAAMVAVVAVVSFLTLRSGARLLPWLVGGTGALSIVTGAIWLQKTSAAIF